MIRACWGVETTVSYNKIPANTFFRHATEIPGVITVMRTYLQPHPLRDWMEHRIEFESQSSVFCSLLQTDRPLLCPLEFCQCLGSKEITETNSRQILCEGRLSSKFSLQLSIWPAA